jgi:ParB/RepB/Spo0J family partition protein
MASAACLETPRSSAIADAAAVVSALRLPSSVESAAGAQESSVSWPETLMQLIERCEGREAEWWQALTVGFALEHCDNFARRLACLLDWNNSTDPEIGWRDAAHAIGDRVAWLSNDEAAVLDELLHFSRRWCGAISTEIKTDQETLVATKAKPTKAPREKPIRGHHRSTATAADLGLKVNDNIPADYQAKLQAGDTSPASTAVLNQAARRGKKAGPAQPAAGPAIAAKMAIVSEAELLLDHIKPSPENPREDWEEKFLQQLGESLRDNGQLSPIVVRVPDPDGIHELVDGETRWRAAKLVGLKSLRATIVECTDAEAAMARVLSYRQRRDLNAIEEARGLALLLNKYQCSQRELEAKIGVSQGQISNRVGLLKLPKNWQKKIIDGEISASAARELAPWAAFPEVFVELDRMMKDPWQRSRITTDPAEAAIDAVHKISTPLEGSEYSQLTHYQQIKWTINLDALDDGQRKSLDVRDVPRRNAKGTTQRAFNQGFAKQLVTEIVAKVMESKKKRADGNDRKSGAKTLSAAEQKAQKEKQAAIYAKKLWRYVVGWHQRQLLAVLDDNRRCPAPENITFWLLAVACQGDGSRNREGGLQSVLKTTAKPVNAVLKLDESDWSKAIPAIAMKWFAHEYEGWRPTVAADDLVAIAQAAGVDLAKEWTLDEAFLELHSKDQLQELLREWKIGMYFVTPTGAWDKRSDLIAGILRHAKAQKLKAPARLLKVKPVSLN